MTHRHIVGVTGGRDFLEKGTVWNTLDCYHDRHNITHLVNGLAKGADSLARQWAIASGVQPVDCPALWDFYGKSAGHRRNYSMKQLIEVLVSFPGGRGTAGMIDIAEKAGILHLPYNQILGAVD